MIPLTDARYGRAFWIGLALGWASIAFGVWGVIHTRIQAVPVSFAGWLIGAAVVHDFIVAPLVFLLGIALRRSLDGRIRAGVQVAVVVSAIVLAYSFPLMLGYGRRPTNPTVQPNDYVTNVALVVAAIWIAAFVWLLVHGRRARKTSE